MIAETLTLKKIIGSTINTETFRIIVESDSQVTVQVILGLSPASKLIRNLAKDIWSLAYNLKYVVIYIVIGLHVSRWIVKKEYWCSFISANFFLRLWSGKRMEKKGSLGWFQIGHGLLEKLYGSRAKQVKSNILCTDSTFNLYCMM